MPRKPSPSERISGLQALARSSPCNLAGLAAALDDPCITVRAEAARLLGQVGGAKETARLHEALSRAIGQRSPVWHRVLGRLTVVGLGVLVPVMILLVGILSLGQAFKLTEIKPWKIWRDIVDAQRGEEPFICACVEALASISERAPLPESQLLVDDLHALFRDEIHLTLESRIAIVTATQRLDDATRRIAELPTPADAPELSTVSLPVMASEPAQTMKVEG